MLRIIVRMEDEAGAVHVGSSVRTFHRTFDVDLPSVEAFLTRLGAYQHAQVVGVEVLPTANPTEVVEP